MSKWPPLIPPSVLNTLAQNRYELVFVAALTLVAAFLRVYNLTGLPEGLHGDEAVTGLDALRVMREGWIGPYVGSALGQPTGPLYFTAFIFMLSDLIAQMIATAASVAIIGIEITMNAIRLKWRCQNEKVKTVVAMIATDRPRLVRNNR